MAFTGAIIVNRYDVGGGPADRRGSCSVSSRRWLTAAAFVLGIGFALKLTPLALLPLVLLLAGRPRRWAWPLLAFAPPR